MADQNDDLEQLLDSALDDFQSLNLTSSSQRNVGGDGVSVKEGKKSVECGRPSLPSGVQGLVMGLPDLKVKKKLKQKLSKGGLEEAISSKGTPAEEAVTKLRMHTNEAIRGLESVTAAPKLDEDDWVKQFMEFSGGQDMESMVETMMQQLLSKEILHEPMKEIGEKYPKWLEDHKGSLSKEDYDRYSQQYKLITNLNDVYDNDPNNFTKIVDLMQKMQECGQPPHDIVQELGPDIDLANLAQLSPEMLDGQTNCCIM